MSETIKLRAVLKGDDMVMGVEGGFIRRPVSEDGIVVAVGAEELFLPADKVAQALLSLEHRRLPVPHVRPMRRAQLVLPTAAKKTASGS